MTYIATIHNRYNNYVDVRIKNNGLKSQITIPADPRLILSALSTYPDLEVKMADDVPKSLRKSELLRASLNIIA